MFCPSCGTANPDEAKFCNECGARVAPPTHQGGGTAQGPGAPRAPAPVSASGQGAGGSLQGFSTADTVASVVSGPTKRQMVLAGVAIGLAGLGLGAVLAYRAARPPDVAPVTPVGLVGDPVPVTGPQTEETDAGTVVPVDPATARRGARVARAPAPARQGPETVAPAPATPATRPSPAAPSRPANTGGTTTPSGNTMRTDDAGVTTVHGPDGEPLVRVTPGGAPPAADASTVAGGGSGGAAPTTLPAAENGVIERGPRSSGSYHMGDETDATGTMDPRAFQYVYRHFQSQIASCHSSASRGTDVSGVMVVRVRIAEEDGRVRSTRIVSDSTRNAQLQACVQNTIRNWRYPRPDGGDVEVDYPLRFGSAR